jgi:hypothetical protein
MKPIGAVRIIFLVEEPHHSGCRSTLHPAQWLRAARLEHCGRATRVSEVVIMSYFNDWKHFCLVLREIASGVDGRPLPGYEAQQRAREALTSAGYRWPGYKPEAPKAVEPPLLEKRRQRA